MVVLRTLLFSLLAAACYSPEIRDCTTTCTGAADCAPGQICGGDGFCAAESVAGTCAQLGPNDAGLDAKPVDAKPMLDAAPDAFPLVKLSLRIDGRGVVELPGIGECDGGNAGTDCVFDVPKALPVTLQAMPKNNWRFDQWFDACAGQLTTTCVLTPMAMAKARIRFVADNDAL